MKDNNHYNFSVMIMFSPLFNEIDAQFISAFSEVYLKFLFCIFAGLDKIKQELGSWDWRFGKTPAFEVKRSFAVPSNLLSTGDDFISKEQDSQELCIKMTVESGLIADVTLNIPPGLMASGFHGDASVVTHLKGKKFTSESLDGMQEVLQTTEYNDGVTDSKGGRKLGEKEQFVANCLDQVVNTM